MKRTELLRVLQTEIRRDPFDTFVDSPPSIAQGGIRCLPRMPGLPEAIVCLRWRMEHLVDHSDSTVEWPSAIPLG